MAILPNIPVPGPNISNACAVCCGSGCVVIAGEDSQPKITDEICPGCNGTGKRASAAVPHS